MGEGRTFVREYGTFVTEDGAKATFRATVELKPKLHAVSPLLYALSVIVILVEIDQEVISY